MIRSLKLRFVLVAMISLTFVLAVIIGGINILSYISVIKSADEILVVLVENNGKFPDFMNVPETPEMPDVPAGNQFQDGDSLPDGSQPPEFDQPMDGEQPQMPPQMIDWQYNDSSELLYETRFFSIVFDRSGEVVDSNLEQIAAIDSDTAVSYAKKVISSGKTRGFINDYRFQLKNNSDGTARVVFYDCGRSLDNFRFFRNMSITVSATGLVFVFILIMIMSNLALNPVKESLQKQKRFITDAGHELKTPLAIINADSDVLEMEIGEDNEWLTDIKNQTRRLSELTNDLILLSKMEEGRDSLNMSMNNLSSITDETVESFVGAFKSADKSIVKNIEGDILMKCDSKALSQVVSILMSNALKYSSDKDSVVVELRKHRNEIRLKVINKPCQDLSSHDLEHVFDRFYRTDKSRNSETGGHGIGLSIARAIVESHGGKITATVGNDKKFYVNVTFS